MNNTIDYNNLMERINDLLPVEQAYPLMPEEAAVEMKPTSNLRANITNRMHKMSKRQLLSMVIRYSSDLEWCERILAPNLDKYSEDLIESILTKTDAMAAAGSYDYSFLTQLQLSPSQLSVLIQRLEKRLISLRVTPPTNWKTLTNQRFTNSVDTDSESE